MFSLFLDKAQPRTAVLNHPLAETIARQYDYTEQVFKDYYARSGFRLPNQHVLVQVLRMLSFRSDSLFADVWATIYARAPYVAKHFGFTSPISFGKPHKNVFYGGDNFSEYLVEHVMHEVEPYGDVKLWRDKSPINVLYHPVVDFHFLLPSGFKQPYKDNYSVVMVDVALLAFQYHMWRSEQYLKFEDKAIISPEAFLVKEVLPKMFRSHFFLTIVNNVFAPGGFGDEKEMNALPWPPLSFPDFVPRVKPMTKSTYRSMLRNGSDYVRVLESIPVPHRKNALRGLILPRVPMTKQGSWVYWLARFRYMFELIRLGGDRGVHSNRRHISALKTELAYFVADKGHLNFKNEALEDEFMYFAGYISNL